MRLAALVVTLAAVTAAPAVAQTDKRIPTFAVDGRVFSSGLKADATTAENLELALQDLPSRANGLVGGAHVYPLRWTNMALGVGAEFMVARGVKQPKDVQGQPIGTRVESQIKSFSPSVSINFGHRNGWSYLSGGMGPLSYITFTGQQAPADSPPKKATINMGGGARWFFNRHLAFCFDVRFYLTRPEAIQGELPGRARQRLLVLSGGIAIK
jgi:hypothetical protein